MATDRAKYRNMRTLREETGIDLAACVQAAYEKGRLQGVSETEARFAEIAGLSESERVRRLRRSMNRQTRNAARLVMQLQHMGRLLMSEHLLVRSRWLGRMIAAAAEARDMGLVARLRRTAAECGLKTARKARKTKR